MSVFEVHCCRDDLHIIHSKLTALGNHLSVLNNTGATIVVEITTITAFLIGIEVDTTPLT